MVTAGLFPVSQIVQQLSGPPAGGAGTRARDSGIRGGGVPGRIHAAPWMNLTDVPSAKEARNKWAQSK